MVFPDMGWRTLEMDLDGTKVMAVAAGGIRHFGRADYDRMVEKYPIEEEFCNEVTILEVRRKRCFAIIIYVRAWN